MRVLAALLVVIGVGPALADLSPQKPLRGFSCEDQRTRGFSFYCDPDAVEDQVPEEEVELDPPPPPPVPTKTYTEQIEEYRAQLEEIKNRAILEPTRENVVAYMACCASM